MLSSNEQSQAFLPLSDGETSTNRCNNCNTKAVAGLVVGAVCLVGTIAIAAGTSGGGAEPQAPEPQAPSVVQALEVQLTQETTVGDEIDFTSEAFLINYKLTNVGDTPQSFLPWFTPLDEEQFVSKDLFLVQDEEGQNVPFSGWHYFRADPTEEDYWTIQPGESKSATVDLTMIYPMVHDGKYTISVKQLDEEGAPQYALTGTALELDMAATFVQSEEISRRLAEYGADGIDGSAFDEEVPTDPATGRRLAQTMNGCTSSQASAVRFGRSGALNSAVPRAQSCLSGGTSRVCSRYATWFGSITTTRYNIVNSCWNRIANTLPSARFECCHRGCGSNCGRGLYGYVYPSDRSMTQYLCSAYFSQQDEQVYTITHEQSHFNVACSTDDHVYGTSGSRNLAQSSPRRAIDNADNHAYFAGR
jgi:peptidyl-Lys metalloendopeptidase